MQKKCRDSNYELMRIISMFMIIIWHIFLYGANMNSAVGTTKLFFDLFRAFMVVHVNSFILVSGYYQIRSKFKMSRVISLNNSVIFYKISIMVIFMLFGWASISKVSVLRNIFPLDLENYWFIQVYLMLYLLSPFLNRFINSISKKQYQKLLILLFIMFSVISTITNQEAVYFTTNYGYSIVSFIFLYFIGAYIRLYPIKDTYIGKRFSTSFQCLMFIFLYICFAFINFSFQILSWKLLEGGELSSYIGNILLISFNQYDNPLVILGSISYFMIFNYIKFNSKFINKIASTSLGIYLIHENLFMRYNMYNIFNFTKIPMQNTVFIRIFISGIIIFCCCSVIELFRMGVFKFIYRRKFSSSFRKKYRNFIDSLGIKINW